MKVYIAAAYADRERAKRWMDKVQETDGLELAHDWIAIIDEVRTEGGRQEADLTADERTDYALEDLKHACDPNVFWFLVPKEGGRGCWFEAGYITFRRGQFGEPVTVASGPHLGVSIFTELLDYKYADDSEAFEFICGMVK